MVFLKLVEIEYDGFLAKLVPLQWQLSQPKELEHSWIYGGHAFVTTFPVQVAVDGCLEVLLKNTNIQLAHHLIYVHILQMLPVHCFFACVELELFTRVNLFVEFSRHHSKYFLLKFIRKKNSLYDQQTSIKPGKTWKICISFEIKSNFVAAKLNFLLLCLTLSSVHCVTCGHKYMFKTSFTNTHVV